MSHITPRYKPKFELNFFVTPKSVRPMVEFIQYLPQLSFAVFTFHAYGHQWPCQLVYHPHKCTGFGLTNGEGCERFWSARAWQQIVIAFANS